MDGMGRKDSFSKPKMNIENNMKKKHVANIRCVDRNPWGLGLQKSLPVFPGGFRITGTWAFFETKGSIQKNREKTCYNLGCPPVTVATRIMIYLVGDPYKHYIICHCYGRGTIHPKLLM